MRRALFVAATLAMATCWGQSAQAQTGQTHDPNAEIESARSHQKALAQKYGRTAGPRARSSYSYGGDKFGRLDMAGHAVPGYPAIRGDVAAGGVSRGGANGVARRRGRR